MNRLMRRIDRRLVKMDGEIGNDRTGSGENRLESAMVPDETGTAWEMPSSAPVSWDAAKCTGCNRCVDICQVDVLLPSEIMGNPPRAAFPGECWYCGCCVTACPVPGAIRLRHPLMNEVNWVPKDSLK
jgi:NAD-dependent dihydropyrimidine dehydrogenase PreA subunit